MITEKETDALIEKQIYDLFQYIAQKGERTLYTGDKIKWVKTVPSTWPNFIFDFRFTDDEIEARVNELNEEIEQLIAPPLCIVPTNEQTATLTTALENNGLRLSAQWTGMALNLELFQPPVLPDGFVIHHVDSLPLLEEWSKVAGQYLFNNSQLDPELFSRFINDKNIKMYLGKYEGIPAATSLVYLSGDAAGLYMIATSNEFRKKGLGTAITSFPIQEAKQLNYKTAILHATAAGRGVYKKIGFADFKVYNIFWKVGKKYKL
ncbi:MAG: GNAT family N-acetyltransferase [Ignavibacteriaceae bacterium]|nr:GNAT family N-acetyltransferase [Ignavibacteriaceae bacterium]